LYFSACALPLRLFTERNIKRRIKFPCYVMLIILGNAPCVVTVSRTKPKAKYLYVSGGQPNNSLAVNVPDVIHVWLTCDNVSGHATLKYTPSIYGVVDAWEQIALNVNSDRDLFALNMTHRETYLNEGTLGANANFFGLNSLIYPALIFLVRISV